MSNKRYQDDDNINKMLQELKGKCFSVIKIHNELEEMMKGIDNASKKEKEEIRSTFESKLEDEEELYDRIVDLGEKIADFNGNKNAIEEVQSKSGELIQKNEGIHKKILSLKKTLDSKAPASSLNNKKSYVEEDNNLNDSNNDLQAQLIVHNVQKNEDFLKKRREDLQDAKVVAGQIRGITQEMKMEVNIQGEKLNEIENHVVDINQEVVKASKEIKKADNVSKTNRNKTWWIIGIIFFVIASAITLILLLTRPWETSTEEKKA